MTDETRIRSVQFRSFKALSDFGIALEHVNVLVGPNNAGKSTVIDAFRLLAAGLRRARAKRPGRIRGSDGVERFGYSVPLELLSISMENIHTDYQSVPSVARFALTNGNSLELYVPAETSDCYLIPHVPDRVVNSVGAFKAHFPVDIAIIPVLGPVEHDEQFVQEETVLRNLATHRASRNFRSYWLWRIRSEGPQSFEVFRSLLRETWPGMDIKPPEAIGEARDRLAMFCAENRIDREIFWAGFGFQVWCQLLTHVVRSPGASILVVDEAELYLHPDLQRQLLARLRSLGPDVVMATHSSEIVGDADPEEVVVVDKTTHKARRVTGAEGVRDALLSLGSNRNFVLSQLARTKRALFVEGDDFKILRAFARRLGLDRLATGYDFAVSPLGGFRRANEIRGICQGMEVALGFKAAFAAVLDRDYRCAQEVADLEAELAFLRFGRILARKEVENYLLVPVVIDRTLARQRAERIRRSGADVSVLPSARELLIEVTEPLKVEVQGPLVASEVDYGKFSMPKMDRSTLTTMAMRDFETRWSDLDTRLDLVPGKRVMSQLNALTQSRFGVTATPSRLVSDFTREEIPDDMKRLLRALDRFRTASAEKSERTEDS